METVIVVGGGAAGMIAAGTAASKGKKVILLEKNDKLGKKIYITGKGRCNVTNNCDIDELLNNVTTNKNFLYSAFYTFTNYDVIELLHKYGTLTKVERGNRVFPKSDKSNDVIKALEKYMKTYNVDIKFNCEVKELLIENNDIKGVRLHNNSIISGNKVIIATGGMSYPSTGSTGDGYKFAKMLGHSIVPLKPALVPLEVEEDWAKELQGLSLKNVLLKTIYKDKEIHVEFGEMIFTHYGISGPIVLSMSNYIKDFLDKGKIKAILNLKPALDKETLEKRIIRDFEKYSKKQFKNSLNDLLPKKLIPIILRLSSIPENKYVNQITKNERKQLVKLLTNLPMTITKTRPIKEAIITSGGINVKEINPSTMESKKIKGVFFVGEILDVDALTGGYNLQIAFSTGYLAGISV
ncbi:NAD(P)/FAD-dependent oxidoreductase [Crassaminicella thermophila]|uniref:NAD(P)/FAD-dependent oxidoreductase n=1 Tax=Crassaminicella thermophila TaxID=2599308 RepID=A0A5C0SE42_CRATE|nr:NAD(P)/FAD-dependent oxidoreductase [Crassaminicella thermophila]QEK12182.1 NAD(P)/FAD-dependent oxidoreductase [Crassaminicella thermophila]